MNKYVRDVLTFPRDARAAWTHAGASGVWREFRLRTLDRISRGGLAVLLEHVVADVPHLPLPEGVRIAPFSGGDWSPFLAFTAPKRIEKFRTRMARGRECLVAWRGDRPVGFTWISRRMERDIETYVLPLPADATYHWDLFVASEERGSGVGTALAYARLHHTHEQSYRVGWRLIDVDNWSSQRGAQKTATESTRVIGELRYRSFFGRSWSHFSSDTISPETKAVRAALVHTR
ncbi:MAG TPA: GNAT family N-acetyltransferase [Gemmatimonadaceae bacterium]|nr:GNAT family N-acetyltransferase [Gemmatimonadaceae bacterium]